MVEILIIMGKIIITLYKNPIYYIKAQDDKILCGRVPKYLSPSMPLATNSVASHKSNELVFCSFLPVFYINPKRCVKSPE